MSRRSARSTQHKYANARERTARPVAATRRRRRWSAAIAAVLVVVFALLATDLARINGGIARIRLDATGGTSTDRTFLIVGTDSRAFVRDPSTASHWGSAAEVPGERADMLAYIRIPRGRRPQLMAIPRDLVVPVRGNGEQRIGLTLTRGPQLLVDTLCDAVGLPVDHIVIVDFLAFRKLVAAAGYIEVTSDVAIRDRVSGLNIERPGTHRLDQDQALSYVRSRQASILDAQGNWVPEPDASEHRVDRQRRALGALAARRGAFSGLIGLRRAAKAADGSTRIDRGFGLSEALTLRRALGAIDDPATNTELRVGYVDGAIPRAYFTAESGADLASIGAGATRDCPLPPTVSAQTARGLEAVRP